MIFASYHYAYKNMYIPWWSAKKLTDNYKKQHILLDSDKKYIYCN